MKKKFIVGAMITCVLTLCSCGEPSYPDLPDNAIAFEMGTFEDTENDEALFGTIEYNGRTYIGYGTINNKFKQKYADECIGYIVQDENSSSVVDVNNKNRRIYTLVGDENHDFLMEYEISDIIFKNQPDFFRAIDTVGKDIEIPEYIDESGHEFWETN